MLRENGDGRHGRREGQDGSLRPKPGAGGRPGRAAAREKPTRANLLPHERDAKQLARRLGLWVLFEGSPTARVWRVYALPVGKSVGAFTYHTLQYAFCGQEGTARDWRHALDLAAEFARRSWPGGM